MRALREVVAKAKGRAVNANFDEKDPKNVGAHLDFDVRRSEEAAIQLALSGAGEVLSRTVVRLPEGNNVTDTKVLFKVEFAANVQPQGHGDGPAGRASMCRSLMPRHFAKWWPRRRAGW